MKTLNNENTNTSIMALKIAKLYAATTMFKFELTAQSAVAIGTYFFGLLIPFLIIAVVLYTIVFVGLARKATREHLTAEQVLGPVFDDEVLNVIKIK